jgi:hypothetical protein
MKLLLKTGLVTILATTLLASVSPQNTAGYATDANSLPDDFYTRIPYLKQAPVVPELQNIR